MPSWNSRGLRGSMLEEALNMTNEQYRKEHLALVQKIPTPITPINIDKEHRHITLAYFEQKSTVDYIGAVQGIPVCFDAKECCVKTFPLANIHPHQVSFMDEFEKEDYEDSKMNESDFECFPRQMAEKLMEFNRDLSDSDEDEINEEIDYLAELFSDLQESEKYNALMHHLDLMFSHEIFQ